ncbi:MAG: hypothetical protein JXA57_16385 [Armatimonadetes bacterium]|nr:hypothetical protein [Armatimonadota bacterium]
MRTGGQKGPLRPLICGVLVALFLGVDIFLLLPVPSAEPEGGIESVSRLIEVNRRRWQQNVPGMSVAYTIERYRRAEDLSALQRISETPTVLTVAGGSWKQAIENVTTVGPDGSRTDNRLVSAWHRGERRTLYETGLASGDRSLQGHIHSEDNLNEGYSYFSFLDRISTRSLEEIVQEYGEEAYLVEAGGDKMAFGFRMTDKNLHVEVTLDPEHDFHVSQYVMRDDEGRLVAKMQTDFARHSRGLWLPFAGVLETYDPRSETPQVVSRVVLKLESIEGVEIRDDFDESLFEIEFPVGTRVTDFTRGGLSYCVGAAPKAVLDRVMRANTGFVIPDEKREGETLGRAELSEGVDSGDTAATSPAPPEGIESSAITFWSTTAAILLVIGTICYWAVRRLRRMRRA